MVDEPLAPGEIRVDLYAGRAEARTLVDGWEVVVDLVRQPSGYVPAACSIRPIDGIVGEGGLTTSQLRHVDLTALTRAANTSIVKALLDAGLDDRATTQTRERPRPGRHGRDDDFYLSWALRYLDTTTRSRRPIPDLAARYALSPARVRDHLRQARRRGLLSSPTRGTSGGTLTDKALQLAHAAQHAAT
jgi:hypothetical protein